MYLFPEEEERSTDVKDNLPLSFDLAEAAYNFWLMAEKDSWIAKCSLPPLAVNLAMLLDVQALRLFRSLIEQCQRCEAFNASILARSLYETVLGVGFLLKEDVRIIVEAKLAQPKVGIGPPSVTGYHAKLKSKLAKRTQKHRLSREVRGKVYYAHSVFQQFERGPKILRLFGSGLRIKPKEKKEIKKLLAEQMAIIGPQWSYILRHEPYSYSGLRINKLAIAVDKSLYRWYRTIYPFQSRAVHGNEPLKHFQRATGNRGHSLFLSRDSDVYEALRTGITMFLVHLGILKDNVGFGPDLEIAFASFKRKMDRMKGKSR